MENIPAQGPGDSGGASTSSPGTLTHQLSSVLGTVCCPWGCRARLRTGGVTHSSCSLLFSPVPTVGCPSTLRAQQPQFLPAVCVSCVPEQLLLQGQPQGLCDSLGGSETPGAQHSFVLVCPELGEHSVPRLCPVVAVRDGIWAQRLTKLRDPQAHV